MAQGLGLLGSYEFRDGLVRIGFRVEGFRCCMSGFMVSGFRGLRGLRASALGLRFRFWVAGLGIGGLKA